MAIPASGIIYFRGTAKELKYNNYYTSTIPPYPIGLEEMSTGQYENETINTNNSATNRPNQTAPHYLTEFYSYNHDQSSGGNGA